MMSNIRQKGSEPEYDEYDENPTKSNRNLYIGLGIAAVIICIVTYVVYLYLSYQSFIRSGAEEQQEVSRLSDSYNAIAAEQEAYKITMAEMVEKARVAKATKDARLAKEASMVL